MPKFLQRSNKSNVMSPLIKTAGTSIFYFLLPFLLFAFLGCYTSAPKKKKKKKNTAEIADIQITITEQQELLFNLQALTADQMERNSELEQSIPPRDLLESLQNRFVELREKITVLEKQVSTLQESTTESAKNKKDPEPSKLEFPTDQKQLLKGLISLQAGNPDQAVEHLQEILKRKKPTQLKAEILLAVARSFLVHGHAKQAASHYGTYLSEYPKSQHIPQALYFLGEALGKLGQQKKQKVLWQELKKKYPKSLFGKLAK